MPSPDKISISRKGLSISINVPPKALSGAAIRELYNLISRYAYRYFITISGVPPCAMPDSKRFLINLPIKDVTYERLPACAQCALQHQCPGWAQNSKLDKRQVRPVGTSPIEVVIETTDRCNLACHRCTTSRREDIDVPEPEIRSVIDEAKAMGIRAIRFTGGEPMLHPNIESILTYAKQLGFYTLMNTNATFLKPPVLKLIDNVLVSLQGYDAESNYTATQARINFENKLNNIREIGKHIPALRLGTVIIPQVVKDFDKYAELVRTLPIINWELFRPMSDIGKKEGIDRESYQQLVEKLYRYKSEGLRVSIANAMPYCLLPNPAMSAAVMLGAESDDGHVRMVRDVRGYWKPSYFINENLGTTIREAWDNPLLKTLRETSYLPLECRQCDFYRWCRGGSRSATKTSSGAYTAPDPLFQARELSALKLSVE